ncbi:hypothetical protein D9758_018670 [Tetrapyrgos nigripes]|uniref:Peptidase A1 domain-containing protein n=1 Tax=Tetrapyrgos nigripes TaxID=182062 RepID=A0A8H5BVI7_9AGAR|nr:hypothetical protein D9758_018670 [Tetrapyrgos nigripes]
MTWKIGGQSYPIHPLDATLNPSIMGMTDGAVRNSNGDDCCIGMFQPISSDRGDDTTYDIILGMSFLRNVYALFDHGDFIEGSNEDRGDLYIQLLSTTDVPSSHLDFVEVRLSGDDTTGTQILNAWDPSLESSDSSTNKSSSGKNSHLKIIFLALAITAGVLGGLLLMWACCCRRKSESNRMRDEWRMGLSSSNSNANNSDSRQSQYDYQGETRYDPVPVHDSHGGSGNSNYAGVGLGRDAPPYLPYDAAFGQGQGHGHEQSLYDPPPQTYNPRASSPSPGGYANTFESRR